MKEGKWTIVGWSLEWWEAGKGETAKLSDQKGQKWGAEIARDRGGGMKGIEDVENAAMMKYGRDPKITEPLRLWGLSSMSLSCPYGGEALPLHGIASLSPWEFFTLR